MSAIILIINGPNLNLLGTREPDIYGHETLADVEGLCMARADTLDLAVDFRQSNSEGEIVGWIQDARTTVAGLIVNAGHGLHYHNTREIAAIPGINELNIGHGIIARAVMTGLDEAVRAMRVLIDGSGAAEGA